MNDTDMDRSGELPKDSGLSGFILLLRFLQVPCDEEQLRHQYGSPGQLFDIEALHRAAKSLKLKSRIISSRWDRLPRLPLPALLETNDGKFLILGKFDPENEAALLQDPVSGKLLKLTQMELEAVWTGRLLMMVRRVSILGRGGKFDISWFIPAMLRYKAHLYQVIGASFFIQSFALASPLFFQVIIDKVLVHRGMTTLDVLMFGLIVVSLFEVLLGAVRTYVFSHTTNRIDVELGAKLFRHLLTLPIAYFESRQVGQTVARVRELENIRNFITSSALVLVVDIFFTFVFFGVMWFFSPMLTMIVLGSIPLYVILAFVITPVLRARTEEKFQKGAQNQAFLVEAVTGIETLKSTAVEPQAQRKWEEQLAAYVHSSFKVLNLSNFAGQSTQLINKVTMALTLYFGAIAVADGSLSVGQLVAFNMLSGRVSGPILRLASLWNEFQQARISVERLGDILNMPTEPTYNPGRSMPEAIEGNIVFEHVGFRYQMDGQQILDDVNLEIKAGEVIGIVGSSGSGKSTLTKLVQRMYVPTQGRVLIDGIDLAMVDTSWLRKRIGVVLQENILFNRSVRENIALSNPGMPMEQIIEAARLAGAEEFVLRLDEGYDTVIGERGSNLSGGQRQRIAIARALVSNPQILIMDEATSALDYESEKIVRDNMRTICKGRTVLIIAHRLGSIRHADRIIVMDKGRVIETGTHEELVAAAGYYAHLHKLGAGDDRDEA